MSNPQTETTSPLHPRRRRHHPHGRTRPERGPDRLEAHHHHHRRQEPQHRQGRPHAAGLLGLVPGPRHADLQEAGTARQLCRQVQRQVPHHAEPDAEAAVEGDPLGCYPSERRQDNNIHSSDDGWLSPESSLLGTYHTPNHNIYIMTRAFPELFCLRTKAFYLITAGVEKGKEDWRIGREGRVGGRIGGEKVGSDCHVLASRGACEHTYMAWRLFGLLGRRTSYHEHKIDDQ